MLSYEATVALATCCVADSVMEVGIFPLVDRSPLELREAEVLIAVAAAIGIVYWRWCACMHLRIHAYKHTCMHTRVHTHTHTHTYTHYTLIGHRLGLGRAGSSGGSEWNSCGYSLPHHIPVGVNRMVMDVSWHRILKETFP